MKSELHLFIIWSNAKYKEINILEDMKSRFEILGIHRVIWNKSNFSSNLTRFYGENLPKNSNKEKLCGNDPFTLVVVKDDNPLYRSRMTSKGPKMVNVNIFDSKEMYRNWTGGGHMIHGTNNIKEVKHDLVLLTGLSVDDYLKKYENKGDVLYDEFNNMPGEEKWDSPQQLLYVLNETTDYVILRNFQGIFSEYGREIHGDVDILAEKAYTVKLALNAKATHKSKYRVQHIVKIGDGGTYFDIRFVGDNYYCKEWEKSILEHRYLDEEGYYRTDAENFKYSLLYHALVQKKNISPDYMDTFRKIFPEISNDSIPNKKLESMLKDYMSTKGYKFTEPNDYTVYFNKNLVGQKMSTKKLFLKSYHKVFK